MSSVSLFYQKSISHLASTCILNLLQVLLNYLFVHDLSIFNDERGSLLHILSSKNYPDFIFGECYGSETKPGVIKAWKRHQKISQNFAVILGKIKLVIFDTRKESPSFNRSFIIELSRENYKLVHVLFMNRYYRVKDY